MKRILAFLIVVCRVLVLISMLVLISSVTAQIFARTFLPQSPIWTEEVTRYALLYTVAFGAGLSMLTGDLVNVDLFLEMLGERSRRIVSALALLITALFAGLIVKPSYDYAQIGAWQTSPAIGIHMIWIYDSMIVLSVLLCLFALVAAIRILKTGHVESGKVGE